MKAPGRHQPLFQQIVDEGIASKPVKRKRTTEREDKDGIILVDPKTTKKILIEAQKQKREVEESNEIQPSRTVDHSESEDDDDDDEGAGDQNDSSYPREEDGSRLMAEMNISDEDARALEMFMSREPAKRRNLGELIAEKLNEQGAELQATLTDVASVQFQKLDPRVYELYKGVKQVLCKYRAGKLPKAFKVIPSFDNWEEIVNITDPDNWTAASMFAATRLFTSGLNDNKAQRFFNLVLLPRVRDDIAEYKRLNYHLYQALRKALFRAGAFFKGIILPLIEGGDCSLREAVIISSVLAKTSVPVLHASAALLKMCEMSYSGATSVFMHTLLSKKYALPYLVVDGIVKHLLTFERDTRDLPVLWHQVFLIFVQQCGKDLTKNQKESLLNLTKMHSHHKITDCIRKELLNSQCTRQ